MTSTFHMVSIFSELRGPEQRRQWAVQQCAIALKSLSCSGARFLKLRADNVAKLEVDGAFFPI